MSTTLKKTSAVKLQQKKPTKKASLPFTALNYYIFAGGVAIILLGYVCLSTPPVYGMLSMTLAPVLLCFGYLVAIPAAILYRQKLPHNEPNA